MADGNPEIFSDRVREWTGPLLDHIAKWLVKMGFHPNTITIIGWVMVLVASILVARGEFLEGGILLFFGLSMDAIDGAVARETNGVNPFGMVLESSLDRYSDSFIFAAFTYYFAVQDRSDIMGLALAALLGSFLVSYVRARADDVKVGVSVKAGWFTRLERVIVILSMILVTVISENPLALEIGLLILAIGTNITVLQRLWYVYAVLKDRGE